MPIISYITDQIALPQQYIRKYLPQPAAMLPMLLLLLTLASWGCAPKGAASVNRMLDNAGNIYVAKHYLGEPDASRQLAGGGTRYEWNLDRMVHESAHYETRQVYMNNDGDGFPVFEDVDYFIPDRDVHQTCQVVVIADAQDTILEHSAKGSHCQVLFKVPMGY